MTKRLFAYSGITMLCTYAAVFYFEFYGALVACAAAVIIFAAAFLYHGAAGSKSAYVLVSMVILVSLLVYAAYDQVYESDVAKYNGRTAVITATALENGYENYGNYYYELETDTINGKSDRIKLLLQANYDLRLEYRDKIKAEVVLRSYDTGCYRSRRFVCSAQSKEFDLDCEITKVGDKGVLYIPIVLREKLSRALRQLIPDVEGELCSAMTFGARSELNKDVYSLISDSGLSFFVVVSGLHMSIISMMLMFVTSPLKNRRKLRLLRSLLSVIGVLTYMAVTGFTASVVRSGVMIMLTLIASGIFKRTDCYNNMGLAALVLAGFNPYAVGDAGLVLSFVSVFGIFYLKPRLLGRIVPAIEQNLVLTSRQLIATNIPSRILKLRLRRARLNLSRAFLEAFAVSLSATLSVTPVIILLFGAANPFVVLVSVLLSPFVTLMIIFSVLASICTFIPIVGSASFILAFPAWLCAGVFLRITGIISTASLWTLRFDKSIVLGIAVVTAAAALMLFLINRKLAAAVPAAIACVLILFYGVSETVTHQSSLNLRFLSSGYGTVIQLSGSGAEAVLAFSGRTFSDAKLIEKLRRNSGNVNTLVTTDDTLATCRTAMSIIKQFDVDTILLYHSSRTAQDLEDTACQADSFAELYGQESVILNFGNNITDTVINTGKYVWHYLKAKGNTVLIAPRGGNADALDDCFRTADCFVAGGDIFGIDNLDFSRFIWLNSGEPPIDTGNTDKIHGVDCILDLY